MSALSRGFRQGDAVDKLINDGVFHPHMRQIIPPEIAHVHGHQERAIRAIHHRKTALVSTGTGWGKTECFLCPIISKCPELKDAGAEAGISAVIVYPMNALAEDQLDRLRGLLAGSGVTFGMYVGKTPENERDVAGHRIPVGSSKADYEAVWKNYRAAGRPYAVHPPEELCSRKAMRSPGGQPRILLTNVKHQQVGLEPWGRLKVRYKGLDASAPFVQTWSNKLRLPPDEFTEGIAAVLDHLRRRRLLYDSRRAIFSRDWNEGDREVQRGYSPVMPEPQGMKLTSDVSRSRFGLLVRTHGATAHGPV